MERFVKRLSVTGENENQHSRCERFEEPEHRDSPRE
jgi:hypothetical protein